MQIQQAQSGQLDMQFDTEQTPNMLLARTLVRLQTEVRTLSHRVAELEAGQTDDGAAVRQGMH
jgi:hypothetical protein